MYYTAKIPIKLSCDELNIWEERDDYSFTFSEDFNDVFAWMFQEKYNVKYGELSWIIEPGAKEFYKELEDKWLHNDLDVSNLYHNEEFLDFVIERKNEDIKEDEIEDALDEALDDIREMVRDELYNMSQEELIELRDDCYSYIDYEVSCGEFYRYGSIYIDDFIEEEEDYE